MRNLYLLKDFIKNILKEDVERQDNVTFDQVTSWMEEHPYWKKFFEQGARENLGEEFLLEKIFDLTESVTVYMDRAEDKVHGLYFNLKKDALQKLGYETEEDPWLGINFPKSKFLFKNFSKKQKSDEEEALGLTSDEAATLTSVVQAAQEQGASTPGEIANQVAQDMNVSDPGGFAQVIVPVVKAAAESGFDGADLSALPKDSQQAAKQVAAKSAKRGSSKTDAKKVIADFTREVIQGMKIQPNRKNASVVDKTLNWLKSQGKLKAESANHSRAKIRNTL